MISSMEMFPLCLMFLTFFLSLGHGTRSHNSRSLDDIIHGDVSIVLDVLNLLSVPWGFLESFDNEGSCRWNNSTSGLSVLNLQLNRHLQTLPISSRLCDV